MTKNIIVTDENGNVIGSTYPKRAQGLVKNGRAEYVSDCMIRLISAHAPIEEIQTEEQKMSKIIEFDPRKFGFDKSCRSNSGQRAFVTTSMGNAEVWEIGDHDKHRTQIVSKMKLQRYSDYIFRFAMTGGHNEDGDEVSLVNLYPENRWEERLTYALDKSRYEPVVSKRDKDGLLRVFELPFNTGTAEDWTVVITQEKAPARFFAPKPNATYAGLSDMSYSQWISENGRKRGFFSREENKSSGFGFNFADPFAGTTIKKLVDMAKQGFDVDKIIDKAKQGFDIDSVIEQVKQGIDPDGNVFSSESKPDYVDNGEETVKGFTTGNNCANLNFSGDITESELADKLILIGNSCNVTVSDMKIQASEDRSCMMIGSTSATCNFTLTNVTMTAYAFSMIMAKIGSSCTVKMENVTITDNGVGMMIDPDSDVSVVTLTLSNIRLPKQALDLIYSKFSTSCNISAENISTTFVSQPEQPKKDTVREEQTEKPKAEAPKQEKPRQDNQGGYYFKDMLKSTFENAAEGLNTFGEMMRKAESDITNVIGDIVNDKKNDAPKEEPEDKNDGSDDENSEE